MDLPGLTLVFESTPHPKDPIGSTLAAQRFPNWKIEIDGVLRVLAELVQWRAADPPPSLEDGWPPSSPLAYVGFTARETARVGALVVFACNVSDMIERQAEQVHGLLDLFEPSGVATRRAERKDHKNRLSTCWQLRHKVFAHTAAVDPKGDSYTVRATSLWHVSGNGSGWRNGEFELGTAQLVQVGDPLDPKALPAMNLERLRAEAAGACAAWWTLLARDVETLKAIPDHEYKEKLVGLVEVIRVDEYVAGAAIGASEP